MKPLIKREIGYYLNNPIGYIIIVLFSFFANFFYVKDIFVVGSASMQPFFNLIPWLFIIFIPAISMRSIAEEKRSNTIETLLTLPISETQIVLSKFIALLSLVFFSLLLTLALPVALSFLTKLYLPEVLIGYVGLLFVGALFIALSLFFSSQTKNQVVAFLLSSLALFLLLVVASDFTATVLPKFIQDQLAYFSPLYHLDSFTKGVLDLRSIMYFISGIVVFIFLTIIDLERRA